MPIEKPDVSETLAAAWISGDPAPIEDIAIKYFTEDSELDCILNDAAIYNLLMIVAQELRRLATVSERLGIHIELNGDQTN